MLKKDFLSKIRILHSEVHDLMLCDSLPFDSALYAFLQTACNCLNCALSHPEDFIVIDHEA